MGKDDPSDWGPNSIKERRKRVWQTIRMTFGSFLAVSGVLTLMAGLVVLVIPLQFSSGSDIYDALKNSTMVSRDFTIFNTLHIGIYCGLISQVTGIVGFFNNRKTALKLIFTFGATCTTILVAGGLIATSYAISWIRMYQETEPQALYESYQASCVTDEDFQYRCCIPYDLYYPCRNFGFAQYEEECARVLSNYVRCAEMNDQATETFFYVDAILLAALCVNALCSGLASIVSLVGLCLECS